MATNENQGKNPSWVMYGLKPFAGFAICLASAFFKTGTKVAVKHLNSVSPVLISCIQYLVIGLLAQPIAACRSNIESPFPKGRPYVSTLLVLLCTQCSNLQKSTLFGSFLDCLKKAFFLTEWLQRDLLIIQPLVHMSHCTIFL